MITPLSTAIVLAALSGYGSCLSNSTRELRGSDRSDDDPAPVEVKFVDLRNRVHTSSPDLFHYKDDKGDRDWAPERAFVRQGPKERPWFGMKRNFPQSIWYDFKNPTYISKIAFRNRRERHHSANNPTTFEFIASNDSREWKTLKKVEKFDWKGNDRQKIWTVQTGWTLRPFKLFGIRVSEISGFQGACIQDIRMWEQGPNTEELGQCEYKFVHERHKRLKYSAAQRECRRWGGNLAMEKTKEIHDEVIGKFGSEFWIGVRGPYMEGQAQRNFKFIDYTTIRKSYFKSKSGKYSTSFKKKRYCVSIFKRFRGETYWRTAECFQKKPYLCQKCKGGKLDIAWRKDGKCGKKSRPCKYCKGEEAGCDPNGEKYCCSKYARCGNSAKHCNCPKCSNYRTGKEVWREWEFK